MSHYCCQLLLVLVENKWNCHQLTFVSKKEIEEKSKHD